MSIANHGSMSASFRRTPKNRRTPKTGRFRGVPADARVEQRRELLIAAGLDCFGNDGFHATGIRQICARAELSERYFYESFENREALFSAVYEHAITRIRERLVEVLQQGPADPRQLVRAVLRAYLELLHGDPRLVRVALIEVNSIGAVLSARSFEVNRSFADLIVPTMQHAFPDLAERGYDALLVAEGLLGSTIFLVTQWAVDNYRASLDTMLEHCVLHYEALLSLS